MDLAAISDSLDRVVARVGHPAEQIYARLFAESPELESLFVLDRNGSVRQEMIRLAFEAILDMCGEGHFARGLIATELTNHGHNGISPDQFMSFFATVRDVVREVNGADWTVETDAAWQVVLGRLGDLVRASAH